MKVLAVMLAIAIGTPAMAAVYRPIESTIVNSVGFVRATIGTKGPYSFLVDTGANRSAIDAKVAADLGLVTDRSDKVEGTAGTTDVGEAIIPELKLGSVRIRRLRPTVSDLSGSLAPKGEQRIAGILGGDALGASAILWDKAGKRLAIGRTAGSLAQLTGAKSVPFKLDNGIPRVEASIDGDPVQLRIDTGASIGDGPLTFVNITQGFYERLRARDSALTPYTYFTAIGTGGEIKIPVVKAHKLEIAGQSVAEPRLIVQQPVGYFARADAVGFLGGYAFVRWRGFIVDYPRRRIILLAGTKPR
jgi:predicted aspartyl protease